MIVYQKGGKDYLLLANSSRGIMKMSTDSIASQESIESHVKDGTKGLGYETIEGWKNIEQLDRFDKDHALVLKRAPEGSAVHLEALPLP
jgi:hypothetical protein